MTNPLDDAIEKVMEPNLVLADVMYVLQRLEKDGWSFKLEAQNSLMNIIRQVRTRTLEEAVEKLDKEMNQIKGVPFGDGYLNGKAHAIDLLQSLAPDSSGEGKVCAAVKAGCKEPSLKTGDFCQFHSDNLPF